MFRSGCVTAGRRWPGRGRRGSPVRTSPTISPRPGSTVTQHDLYRVVCGCGRRHVAARPGGVTGLGVVARRLDDLDLLREVLAYLVLLTEPIDGLPGWWCPHGPSRTKAGPPGGHGNHGIAHGITGPAALLALALLDGVRVDGQEQALRTICQWLDTWRRPASEGSWWPEFVTLDDLDCGEPRQRGPLRPSWCYGAPGIARTQQLAARALGDTTREHLAETAFAACIRDPAQLARLTEPGLCHGTAGLLATARRIAADARTPIALAPLLRLHQDTAAAADASPGFLDGSAGAELAVAGTTTSWDACLLLC
ncbi:lanthionine synthetase [Frankia sp. B2]|nr:lanthionine synthetase [Frankia sp. B2]